MSAGRFRKLASLERQNRFRTTGFFFFIIIIPHKELLPSAAQRAGPAQPQKEGGKEGGWKGSRATG